MGEAMPAGRPDCVRVQWHLVAGLVPAMPSLGGPWGSLCGNRAWHAGAVGLRAQALEKTVSMVGVQKAWLNRAFPPFGVQAKYQ